MDTKQVTEITKLKEEDKTSDDAQIRCLIPYRDYFLYENTRTEISSIKNDDKNLIYKINMGDILIANLYTYALFPDIMGRELYIQKITKQSELEKAIDEKTNQPYYYIDCEFETIIRPSIKKDKVEGGSMKLILIEPNIMEFKVIKHFESTLDTSDKKNACYNLIYMLNVTEYVPVQDVYQRKLEY